MSGWLDDLLGYKDILVDGTAVTRRAKLNFIGATAADNPTEARTDLTITVSPLAASATYHETDTTIPVGELGRFNLDTAVAPVTATLASGTIHGQRIAVALNEGEAYDLSVDMANVEADHGDIVLGSTGVRQVNLFWSIPGGEDASTWIVESTVVVEAGAPSDLIVYDYGSTPAGNVYATWATAYAAAIALGGMARILVRDAVGDTTLNSGAYNLSTIKLVGDIANNATPYVTIIFGGTATLAGTRRIDLKDIKLDWDSSAVGVTTTANRCDIQLDNSSIDTSVAAIVVLATGTNASMTVRMDAQSLVLGAAPSIDATPGTGYVTIYGGIDANENATNVNVTAYSTEKRSDPDAFVGPNASFRRYKTPLIYVTPAAFAAQQNDYDPQDLHNCDVLGLTSTGAQNISGFAAEYPELIKIINIGAANISFLNESVSSTAFNRLTTSTGATLVLTPGAWACMFSDPVSGRWRITLI